MSSFRFKQEFTFGHLLLLVLEDLKLVGRVEGDLTDLLVCRPELHHATVGQF